MTKLVTVRPFSISRFLDQHKSEMFVAGQIPAGLFLIYYASAVLLPECISIFYSGGFSSLIVCFILSALSLFMLLLGGKVIITGTLQLMILRGMRSQQYAQTKRLCLRGIAFLRYWPASRTDVPFFQVGLGAICMAHADYSEAEELFQSAVSVYKSRRGRSVGKYRRRLTASKVVCLTHLACAQAAQGKFAQADSAAAEALTLARSVTNKSYGRLQVLGLYAAGFSHLRAGNLDQAEAECLELLSIYAKSPSMPAYSNATFAPYLVAATLGLAIISIKQNKPEQSLVYWKDYRQRLSQLTTPLSPSALRGLNVLANEYMNNKLFAEADEVIALAYNLAQHHFDHPDAKETLNYFEKLLLLTNRQEDVPNMRAWLHLPMVEG